MNIQVEADTDYRVGGGTDRPTVVEAVAQPSARKNRAERRARGHRTSPRVHSARLRQDPRAETGAQRAQRRAAAKGLTVGAPVRAVLGRPTAMNWPEAVPGKRYGQDHYAGQEGAAPLDVAARLFNYQTQVSVRGHALVGTNWQPTPRQFRRIIKNVSSRATREMLRADRDRRRPRYVAPSHEVVTNLATGEQRTEPLAAPVSPQQFAAWNEPARLGVAPPVMQQNPPERGFRVVDRRGEHR